MTVSRIITGRKKDLGGFQVSRVLPIAKKRRVGPFVFFDEMGPATFQPGDGIDVRAHPHIGLATVTYLFDGEMDHADSLGVMKTITPGAVNLMTAGRGIVHSERTGPKPRAAGHHLHGIQVWIALPQGTEDQAPDFQHVAAYDIPEVIQGGATLRVIMGEAFGIRSPVKTHSHTLYVHAECPAGSVFQLPPGQGELAAYIVSGQIDTGGEPVSAGRMAVFGAGEAPVIRARADSRVMVLGGADLGERHVEWNFVASKKNRIEQAKADWRASAKAGFHDAVFALPESEAEYIPLPGDPDPHSDTGRPPQPPRNRAEPTR
jgi:redox-sensitive bicupin YhaK (pirin superfamily)